MVEETEKKSLTTEETPQVEVEQPQDQPNQEEETTAEASSEDQASAQDESNDTDDTENVAERDSDEDSDSDEEDDNDDDSNDEVSDEDDSDSDSESDEEGNNLSELITAANILDDDDDDDEWWTTEDDYSKAEREKLEKLYTSTLRQFDENEIVEGVISAVGEKEVVLNIGFKSEGVVPISEFRDMEELTGGNPR